MQFTLRARIHDESLSPILGDMGIQLSRLKRKFFVQFGILKETQSKLKKDFIAQEGITARQFNAIAFDVKGLISAQKELNQKLIKKTQNKIKKIQEKIKKSKSLFKIHQFKRQLGQKKEKLVSYQKRLKKPVVCFGEKKLFQKQFYLKENGIQSHTDWKARWKATREGSFFLIGSKDEKFGNQSCQLLPHGLKLRLTHTLAQKYGSEWIEIPIQFTYQTQTLQKAQASGQALHYRFLKNEKGQWYVHLTFDLPEVPWVTDPKYGALGIDLNPSCIAVTQVDPHGNYLSSWQVPVQLEGKSTAQVEAILGNECVKLVQYAKNNQIPIVIEELDFESKKQQLRSRTMNRMLSQFAYSKFNQLITSQCYREGVEKREENPAYTSTIGKVKFSLGYGLSTHNGAAMAIARRGLKFGERLRVKSRFRLSLPDRNRRKHVWADWRQINPRVFPEKYILWEDRQCPEHPQSEKSSSVTHASDLPRIRKDFESEVTRLAQASVEFPHVNRQPYCSPGVLEE